jgi:hypothetical protein
MVLALSLWVCSALPVAEVPRSGVALKDAAAQVLLLDEHPTVSIDPGGGQKALPAVPGMLLLKSDRVVVGPGDWVALAIIGNGHVVRLDDDLSLLVGDLALLNAPMQSEGVREQLDVLLTKKEKERAGRLIGWHASQTAANTQPVQKEKMDTGGGGMTKSRGSSEERVQAKSNKVDEEPVAAKPSPPPAQPAAPAPPPAPPPPPPGSGSAAVPARKRPEPVAERKRATIDPGLQTCVDLAMSTWSDDVKAKLSGQLTVSAKLRDGEVIVSLPLGLPPDPCFARYFQDHGGLSASWTRVTVPLK